MKSRIIMKAALFTSVIGSIISCSNDSSKSPDLTAEEIQAIKHPLVERVLTAEEQRALTAEGVLQSLKDGNKRFAANSLTARDHSAMVRDAARGQFPKAVILSCLDSRIPVEDVFDRGIGDLFVARVAGNFVNTDILGSMEFGCHVMGARLILVLGHESCGAINSTIDNVQLGNITSMLANIRPAVDRSKNFEGEQVSSNAVFVERVAHENILHAIETIRNNSPILKEMESKGEIKIVGGYYNMHTGTIAFL
jgi:carbonic anhydrase